VLDADDFAPAFRRVGVHEESQVTRKRHSPEEIAGKLRLGLEMTDKGRRQDEIARALGISIMTYHRWRKARPDVVNGDARPTLRRDPPPNPAFTQDIVRLDELRTENDRLRRLVANLMLEKVMLEEMLHKQGAAGSSARKPSGYLR
jgi:putative transposase